MPTILKNHAAVIVVFAIVDFRNPLISLFFFKSFLNRMNYVFDEKGDPIFETKLAR